MSGSIQTGTLVDLFISLHSFVQELGWIGALVGAAAGIAMAGHSGYGLWLHVTDEARNHQGSKGGMIAGIVTGGMMTIIGVLVGWFSLFYT